jgi:aldehyde:ferredoxin oxidoreductase
MEDKLLRIDMTKLEITEEPFPEEWNYLGGRSLSAKILLKECDPKCDPLGPDNVVVIAPGMLSGSVAPTSGRMSIGAKSPLTGGIKEANSGGQAGQKLARLGYRAAIVTGKAADPEKRYKVVVDKDGFAIVEAPELKMLRTYATSEKLQESHSDRAVYLMVGPAGELGLTGASVGMTDEGAKHPARHAARGGLGAALGIKGLKALVVDDSGTKARMPEDMAAFKTTVKRMSDEHKNGPQIFKTGTSSTVPVANMIGTFPTRNRREMAFDKADALDGARIQEKFEERGGGMHHCMTGCIVTCSNVVHGADGEYVTSALEFETLALCGSNCEIGDIDIVARMDRLCDELGLDTIETGAAVGMAMEAGKLEFGDGEGALALMEKIDQGDDLAEALGHGVCAVAKMFNIERVPAIRGQAIPAWEPRTLNATGVTYATSAMGADHTAGLIVMLPEGLSEAQASQEAQLVNALCDSSGFCQFQQPTIDDIRELFGAMYGKAVSFEEACDLGWQCMVDEWEFNKRVGFGPEDNDLPQWCREEAVPQNGAVFATPKEEIDKVFERFPASENLKIMRAVG